MGKEGQNGLVSHIHIIDARLFQTKHPGAEPPADNLCGSRENMVPFRGVIVGMASLLGVQHVADFFGQGDR